MFGIIGNKFNIISMILKYLIISFFIFSSALLFSQTKESNFSTKYSYIGFGWVGADDNADFSPDFSKSSINQVYYPSIISLGRVFDSNLRFDLSSFYTKLNKDVYGERYASPGSMISCDISAGYLVQLIGGVRKNFSDRKKSDKISFDFYPLIGAGYTYRTLSKPDLVNSVTSNVGGGTNLWINKKRIGLNLQAMGKFGLKQGFPRNGSNYIQYSVCINYRMKKSSGSPSNLNRERGKF